MEFGMFHQFPVVPGQSETGEGVCLVRPSPSQRCALGPSLSRNAGVGLSYFFASA